MSLSFDDPKVIAVCRDNDIALLRLYGSHARGEERGDSDVDLLVTFSRPKSLLAVVGIERQLSEALGRRVDLLTEPAISPYLRDRILSEARDVYHAR